MLGQGDDLDPARTIREELVGGRADHEWMADAAYRNVLDGLLGGVEISRFPQGLDTPIAPLSGGERRRIALAQVLLDHPELLLLDEPTNHLDVEGVDWLARHLAARRGSMLVVTHDRWFLDAVCTHTWEVADTDGPPVRGRLRGLHAGPRGACAPGRGARGTPPAADPQGARVAAARPAGAHVQAEVPHRGRQRADRRRARTARPRRAAALRHDPARQQGDRRRARLAGLRRSRGSCAMPPGGSARPTASRWSASTARARRR